LGHLKVLAARPPVTVLIVNDHGIVSDGVRLLLQKQPGLKVVGTANGTTIPVAHTPGRRWADPFAVGHRSGLARAQCLSGAH
jgi:hypothetical protein